MAAVTIFSLLLIIPYINLNFAKPGVIKQELFPSDFGNFTITSHLEYPYIKKLCSTISIRQSICNSTTTSVCGMRHFQNQVQYEDFENTCFMFLRNMCDFPGEEYYIISSGTCKDFFRNRRKQKKARRAEDDEEADEGVTESNKTVDETLSNMNDEEVTEPIEEENDVTTQSDDEYETIGVTETYSITPFSRIKHPTASLMKRKEKKGKTTESTNKKAKKKKITTDVTIPISRNNHKKAALRAATTKATTKPPTKATTKPPTKATTKPPTKATAKATTKTAATPKMTAKTTTKKAATKATRKPRSTIYPVAVDWEDRPCPLTCVTTYDPICIYANRGEMLHYKVFNFINRCLGAQYYCRHPEDFAPPPGHYLDVKHSKLGYTHCAHNRYILFNQFSQVTSSMAHYGWLAGNYRPTHIMEPHEKLPGYG